ncbi:MAG: hypothetical protein M3Z09_18655 [Acidobacteriota bacterium]|nr:hypothetical protein [Acidobacteriota bacterium]
MPPVPAEIPSSDAPPFLHRWRNVYALVLAVLALDILVLAAFTHHFE